MLLRIFMAYFYNYGFFFVLLWFDVSFWKVFFFNYKIKSHRRNGFKLYISMWLLADIWDAGKYEDWNNLLLVYKSYQ